MFIKFQYYLFLIGKNILIVLLSLLVAVIIRKLFLSSLENKVVWITFYPAVMVSALLGGFFTGLLSGILACLIAIFAWRFFTPIPFISIQADWISLIVFLINTTLISFVAQSSRFQRKKANEAKDKAVKANNAKSQFLATMSHELRTPLNAILGFSQLMKESKNIKEKDRQNLDIITQSGKHLLNLINEVLDISKIEAGEINIRETTFNLMNVIQEVMHIMSQKADSKNIDLISDFENNLPIAVYSDQQKIKQILINLLGNAIKFTEYGTVKITVSFKELGIENMINIVFAVSDTGSGIPKDDIKRIFNPFQQGRNTKLQSGTGLGLAITKQYVELLNGTIDVETELGKGSIFTVVIPIEISTKTKVLAVRNQFLNVKSIKPHQKPFKILIVEDQIENWLLLQRIHENIGLQVKIAENGKKGLEIFETWQPDLIWMDVRMPEMDGIEATKRIRENPDGKNVKIIGISAHVFKEEIKNVMGAGMDGFIRKPYQFYEIYECLQQHLGVAYLYNEEKKDHSEILLTIDLMKQITKSKLKSLRRSIVELDNDMIHQAILDISSDNEEIGNLLESYVDKLRYTEIFKMINTIQENANE